MRNWQEWERFDDNYDGQLDRLLEQKNITPYMLFQIEGHVLAIRDATQFLCKAVVIACYMMVPIVALCVWTLLDRLKDLL